MTLRLNGSTSGYSEIDAPAIAGNNTITLPSANGAANQLLKNGATAGSLEFTNDVVVDGSGKLLSPNGAAFFGTVTDSGNGAIMESGSNANGAFIKYANGLQICTRNIAGASIANGAAETLEWTYPAAFLSGGGRPTVLGAGAGARGMLVNVRNDGTGGVTTTKADVLITNQGSLFGSSFTTNSRACLVAFGIWY